MARKIKSKKTKTTRKISRKTVELAPEPLNYETDESSSAFPDYNQNKNIPNTQSKSKLSSWWGILLLALVLVGIMVFKKGYIISAMVDGKPIFSWQLYSALNQRFGQQILDGLITEKLISNEAAKFGINVMTKDIDDRKNEMLKSLGENVTLDDLLKYQGITKEDFNSQVRLQLWVEKILGKDINITDNDIDNYIATNRARLVATEEGALKEEARKMILEQLIGQKVQPWFNDLKAKAKILRFL